MSIAQDITTAVAPRAVSETTDVPLHIDDLLRYAVSVGASDLHLTSEMPGLIRLNGAVRPIEGCPPLDHETIREMVFGILSQSKREQFEAEKELDTSHTIRNVGRFRVNVFLQRGTMAAVLRAIPHEIPEFSSLNIPESVLQFAEMRQGFVLVTGPTGSGKSTTLASLVDIINRTKPLHIVTIEDPIEFLHHHKQSIVNQREVGSDTKSFSEAMRRVLREDPDVILVGEMRDLETTQMALTAAETGHLVFATLHTQDAPQTIDRVIDIFPTHQQSQVRTMLAGALQGVVTQQLVPTADASGRVAACEVMMCTSAIRNLIRSEKTHQMYSLMQTGGQYGMQTMDQGLARLVRDRKITESIAFDRCRNEEDLRNHLRSEML
jgi:twitching motility protein PilT